MAADKTDYAIFNIPLLARNIAASRLKRLYSGVPDEYADMKSLELEMGIWSIDPTTHEPINSRGQTLIEDLEYAINGPKPRPHWEVRELPDEVAAVDAIWTSANMSARGDRWKALREYHRSDNLANIAFAEEAARYGVKHPFSPEVGTKPGEKKSEGEKSSGPPLSQNPWSPEYLKRHTPADAIAEQTRLIRLGSKLAANTARAAGVSVFGVPLK